MKEAPQALIDGINALLVEHCENSLDYADAVGQCMAHLTGCCPGNTADWSMGGFVYGVILKTGAVKAVQDIVEALYKAGYSAGKRYNYNDLDNDLLAWKFKARWVSKAMPSVKGCEKDTVYYDDCWFLYYNSHGNAAIYLVQERFGRIELHIRKLPYNLSKTETKKILSRLRGQLRDREKDAPYGDYLTYLDRRDEGFVLSCSYDDNERAKAKYQKLDPEADLSYLDNKEERHECQARHDVVFYLNTATQHFCCVQKDIDNGEPSTL